MKKSESQDIAEFYALTGQMVHSVPGHLSAKKLDERIKFMTEELDEFKDAALFQNLDDMVDALVDLVYVIKGTALMLGVPWERHWDEVHRANMKKRPGVKNGRMRVDAVKPPDWTPPDHMSILFEHGYTVESKHERNHRDDEL